MNKTIRIIYISLLTLITISSFVYAKVKAAEAKKEYLAGRENLEIAVEAQARAEEAAAEAVKARAEAKVNAEEAIRMKKAYDKLYSELQACIRN